MASKLEKRFQQLEKRVEGLEDTVEIMRDPETMGDIRKALADLKEGKYRVYDDIDSYVAQLDPSS